ncbi:MAG: hypothetical protein Q8Q48_03665 [Candidatus Staskawiczbacteria bacterium]|nr:hypothetical protein [Candidatus Staskawiczbacteria bacterium]
MPEPTPENHEPEQEQNLTPAQPKITETESVKTDLKKFENEAKEHWR